MTSTNEMACRVTDGLERLELLYNPEPLLRVLRDSAWPSELAEPITEVTQILEALQTREEMSAIAARLRPRLRAWARSVR